MFLPKAAYNALHLLYAYDYDIYDGVSFKFTDIPDEILNIIFGTGRRMFAKHENGDTNYEFEFFGGMFFCFNYCSNYNMGIPYPSQRPMFFNLHPHVLEQTSSYRVVKKVDHAYSWYRVPAELFAHGYPYSRPDDEEDYFTMALRKFMHLLNDKGEEYLKSILWSSMSSELDIRINIISNPNDIYRPDCSTGNTIVRVNFADEKLAEYYGLKKDGNQLIFCMLGHRIADYPDKKCVKEFIADNMKEMEEKVENGYYPKELFNLPVMKEIVSQIFAMVGEHWFEAHGRVNDDSLPKIQHFGHWMKADVQFFMDLLQSIKVLNDLDEVRMKWRSSQMHTFLKEVESLYTLSQSNVQMPHQLVRVFTFRPPRVQEILNHDLCFLFPRNPLAGENIAYMAKSALSCVLPHDLDSLNALLKSRDGQMFSTCRHRIQHSWRAHFSPLQDGCDSGYDADCAPDFDAQFFILLPRVCDTKEVTALYDLFFQQNENDKRGKGIVRPEFDTSSIVNGRSGWKAWCNMLNVFKDKSHKSDGTFDLEFVRHHSPYLYYVANLVQNVESLHHFFTLPKNRKLFTRADGTVECCSHSKRIFQRFVPYNSNDSGEKMIKYHTLPDEESGVTFKFSTTCVMGIEGFIEHYFAEPNALFYETDMDNECYPLRLLRETTKSSETPLKIEYPPPMVGDLYYPSDWKLDPMNVKQSLLEFVQFPEMDDVMRLMRNECYEDAQ